MIRVSVLSLALLVALTAGASARPAFATSDSRFDVAKDKATRLVISEETLDEMVARLRQLASNKIVQDLDALPFLEDANQLLSTKRREDSTIVGLEFTYTSDSKDCRLYYRSQSQRRGVQKMFWKQEKGSCQLLQRVTFSVFLQTVKNRTRLSLQKSGYSKDPIGWAMADDVVMLARHPELERVMTDLGLQVITFPVPVKAIKVKLGDTMWGIAGREGHPDAWKLIGATSGASLGAERLASWNALEVGDELYAPAWLGTKTAVKIHATTPGETLKDLSRKQFGKNDYWGLVYLLNWHQLGDLEKLPKMVIVPTSTDFIIQNTNDTVELKAVIGGTTPPKE